jgi:hypothetical protein
MAWSDACMMQKKDCKPSHFGLAYMLAGDPPSDASSNIDPFTTVAAADNQWVTEGPHVMIVGRDPAMLEGISAAPKFLRTVCDVEGYALCTHHDAHWAAA